MKQTMVGAKKVGTLQRNAKRMLGNKEQNQPAASMNYESRSTFKLAYT